MATDVPSARRTSARDLIQGNLIQIMMERYALDGHRAQLNSDRAPSSIPGWVDSVEQR